ncbi:MAG: hypothetical protein SCARUB_02639 [Candidatus Scalindua rubra]|uniref:Putative zinc-finger domain-containing protein n=1 Tax=Candidatus Scalindua rubra TaxID=1872076 RepID=A0A1E3X9D4_9BACT|nr:MAG: hypothetical protein SCARUB_02639 [Candidatus Scalindua rubra]
MNCNDIRKYFYAFIDNELDVEKNIEVLAHLDMCYECSHKIEKERFLHKRVKETVSMVKVPDYLEHIILERVEKKPNFFALFKKNLFLRSRIMPLAGIATAIILIVCFFVIIPGNLKKNDFLYLAESGYHNYVMQQLDLDIRSRDAETIEKYLQKQTNSSVILPEIKDDVSLIGVALSEVDGVKVSQVFYMHDETPVSLMIICNSDFISGYGKSIDFSGMKEISIDGKVVYYDDKGYCGHCQIMGWKEVGNQYVIVSKLKSDEMVKMLTKV